MGIPPHYPYPGLRPFTRHESDIFFGRELQVNQLLEKLNHTRFVAVVGTSGCGKSSLLNAGLIPALETGFMPSAGARWRVVSMRPGTDPMRRLAEAMSGVLTPPAGLERSEVHAWLYATVERGPLGLRDALTESLWPERTNLLVIADQFEEIFRYRQGDPDQANAFVAMLLATAAQELLPVYVVIALRSERLGDCAVFSGLPEAINESLFLTPRLTREQRLEAIVGPARVYGGDVEPGLVNRLLNEMGADPDQLPLMQHALMRTWRRAAQTVSSKGVGGPSEGLPAREIAGPIGEFTLTLRDYDSVGGLAQALSKHADQAFEELDKARQRIAEIMFRRLTNEGTGPRDTRRPISIGEVADVAAVSVAEVSKVVSAFRRPGREFLTISRGGAGPVLEEQLAGRSPDEELPRDTVLDISHESLIRRWDRLNAWVMQEAKVADDYRRLRSTAQRQKEHNAALWGSPDLDVALHWKAREKPNEYWAERYGGDWELVEQFIKASEEKRRKDEADARRDAEAKLQREEAVRRRELERAQAFAEAQQQAAEAERRRAETERYSAARLRRYMRALTALLVAVLVVAGYAWKQFTTAQKHKTAAQQHLSAAVSQQLAARAIRRANDQLDLALLLSVAAHRTHDTFEARSSLLQLMMFDPYIVRFLYGPAPVLGVAFGGAGDLKRLAAGNADGSVSVWDATTGGPLGPPVKEHEGPVRSVAITMDGSRLASGGEDGRICLWNLSKGTPTLLLKVEDRFGPVLSLAFHPKGKQLAVGGSRKDDEKDGIISLLDVETGKHDGEPLRGHTGPVRSVAFTADGRRLASGSQDTTIRLWDLAAGTSGEVLVAHVAPVQSVAFTSDSKTLAAASADGTISVSVARETGLSLDRHLTGGHTGPVSSVAFTPDGRLASGGEEDRTIRLWNVSAGTSHVLGRHSDGVLTLALSDGTLASGSKDNRVILWNVVPPPGETLRPSHIPAGEEKAVAMKKAIALSGNGQKLAQVMPEPGGDVIHISENGTNQSTRLPEPGDAGSLTGEGKKGPAGRGDLGPLSLSEKELEQLKQLKQLKNKLVLSLAFSPRADKLAFARGDMRIHVWDVNTKRYGKPLEGHREAMLSLAFDRDGKKLASGGGDSGGGGIILVWDLTASAEPQELRIGTNPDGSKSGPESGPVTSLAWSPNGKKLAASSRDQRVRICTVASRSCDVLGRATEGVKGKAVTSMTFLDDNTLVLGFAGGAVRLWDIAARESLLSLDMDFSEPDAEVFSLSVKGEGNNSVLLSGGRDQRTLVKTKSWKVVDVASLKRRACTIVNRQLEQPEWNEHVGKDHKFDPTCPDAPVVNRGQRAGVVSR